MNINKYIKGDALNPELVSILEKDFKQCEFSEEIIDELIYKWKLTTEDETISRSLVEGRTF